MVNDHFRRLNDYARQVQADIGATAAAVYIIQRGRVVNEWYAGTHDESPNSRRVDAKSQFNVASVRKTYLALAISLLIEHGAIRDIDDEIGAYLPEYASAAKGVTLRHLLTHSHGLNEAEGRLIREFPAGEGWAYRNIGITMLIRLVHALSGLHLSAFMQKHVFDRYGLRETGWRTAPEADLIYNYYRDPDTWVGPNDRDTGEQSNLFVSARDLAKWGYLHLKAGWFNGEQQIPGAVFERVVMPITPSSVPPGEPRHGFIWWLPSNSPLGQIGKLLPASSYQMLGITGCACLVVPDYDAIVVRMYNQLSNPHGYDYLRDIREFGNLADEGLKALAANGMSC
ncbi:serine hydrolase domain-containing protein [Paenibacillus aurantiacus]|uniref:Serine hydrolase domain-containing protein n=1 Tax=Paenibacillus aurantiacus TaxID=1936118 RepID=A0ABV5KHV1_9BACL